MLAKKILIAATAAATLGFAAPAMAGEGSPDMDSASRANAYGYVGPGYGAGYMRGSMYWGAPAYESAPVYSERYIESDDTVGYATTRPGFYDED